MDKKVEKTKGKLEKRPLAPGMPQGAELQALGDQMVQAMCDNLNAVAEAREAMKTVYVDMDNVLVDFKSGLARVDEATRRLYEGREDDIPGIFALMEPMTGAIAAYGELKKRFHVYILSTAPWENPSAWPDKLLWVKKHLGYAAHKTLILTHHKNLNRGHFLIDDRDKNGAAEFEGERILFGSEKFPDWEAVLKHVLPHGVDMSTP